jgi:hypothetical protein
MSAPGILEPNDPKGMGGSRLIAIGRWSPSKGGVTAKGEWHSSVFLGKVIMIIKRRKFISLITSFAAVISIFISSSLARKKSSSLTRTRSLPFLLGWYDDLVMPGVVNEAAANGIKLLIPYTGGANKHNIKAYLDAAQKVGVKLSLEIYSPLVETGNISGVRDFIRTYKSHPAVYGWYLYDEPDLKKPTPLSPDLLTNVYQAIKAEDKSKPVALIFNDPNKIEYYSNAMDILMWDSYPCEEGVSEFQWVNSYRLTLNKVVAIAYAKNKIFWNVLQAYGTENNKRFPTKAEFRYMFYLSVLAGADGLLFFSHPRSLPSWNKSVLYPTIKEFRAYIPAIVKGHDSSYLSQQNLSSIFETIKLFPIPNTKEFLIIAINHNKTQVDLNVKFSPKLASKAVILNQESVTKIALDGSLNVVLNPYEVRLYKIG